MALGVNTAAIELREYMGNAASAAMPFTIPLRLTDFIDRELPCSYDFSYDSVRKI
ncbi:hypothetical protein TUMSATVNIG3_38480 [Vibrio nigripulchritudo]|nr:hypothetical protein TUMSATVNIG2_37990 [Vibrio nigripulchritudo]BDU45050.1 hypothetical protein TUMSATVNIG3_38480 [Vibrio nigripulchritudo]